MGEVSTIGLDIAKSVFQVHGVDADGAVVIRKRVSRVKVLEFFVALPARLIGIEACPSAHYWSCKGPGTRPHRYMRGWRGYFGFCETPQVLVALTRWVPIAIASRFVASVENTTSSSRGTNRTASSGELRNTATSGRGPWHIARSKALSMGLSNAHFKSLGLPSLIEAR